MKAMRWVAIAFGVLFSILVIAGGVVIVLTNNRINATFDIPEIAALELPTDEESLAEGERLFISRGCSDCHNINGSGGDFINDPAIGYIAAANLTSGKGGTADLYQDSSDWIRSIRHGVDPEGNNLWFMPAHEFGHFSDADMSKIIAYIQTLEPVDENYPANSLGPVGRILFLTNQFPLIPAEMIDHQTVKAWNDVEVAASVEYGEYMSLGCTGCHGAGFSGGVIPGAPPDFLPARNITFHETGIEGWTLEDFQKAVQNGIRPNGEILNPTYMPWGALALLNDTEVEAIYLYLQSVEPKELGNR